MLTYRSRPMHPSFYTRQRQNEISSNRYYLELERRFPLVTLVKPPIFRRSLYHYSSVQKTLNVPNALMMLFKS